MAYTATVIPVMIASPGDVAEERQVIREIIHEWNDINSARSKVMLTPIGWETHTSPELGVRPQELINQRLLVDCDLLIGVFWTRLGSPTGNEASGTVEEIHRHLNAGKPAMIYFSSKPVAPESLDREQYESLKLFKTECMQKGLIESFNDLSDFKDKVRRQLSIIISSSPYLSYLISTINNSPDANTSQSLPESNLSADALSLLKLACVDDSGTIYVIRHLGGTDIQAGNQSFGGSSAREVARWEGALNELLSFDFVIERGAKGQMYYVTHKGWTFLESLNE
ncbi:TPA: hypothetical protein RH271_000799 [Escherichia coli]|nr:hypothetical protein [Escherichia coli]HDV3297182.1 hypothetical protein [Escherichia coli]HDV3362372.1 hypothetical protein [Escherichia coli]HDV3935974.1 hypothetical protein [Escherichia coli]